MDRDAELIELQAKANVLGAELKLDDKMGWEWVLPNHIESAQWHMTPLSAFASLLSYLQGNKDEGI